MIHSEAWDPLTSSSMSTVIALVAMIMSGGFSLIAYRETRKQVRLQRFQARQELRNHARAWADEVVENMQDGITHCFIYKRNPDYAVASLQFTRLAGKLSELIDRGRWHFENNKDNCFGEWKEGAYQGLAPKAIHFMKQAHELLAAAAVKPPGTSCDYDNLRRNLTRKKRDFVSTVQNFVQPSRSIGELSF